MPEIGLTGLPLDYPYSGTAVYARNLVPRLPAQAPDLQFCLFTRWHQPAFPAMSSVNLTTPFAPINRGRGIGARLDKLAWEVAAVPLAAVIRRQDLVHYLYLAAPLISDCRVILTIHDLVPLALPDYHRGRQSALYSRLMARMARRTDAVITVSQHSRQDIVRLLGIPEHRVHVTYEAVDERFVPSSMPGEAEALRQKYRLPGCFLLYLGGAERRKNIATLVRAWAKVAQDMRRQEVRLVIVADFPPPDALYPDIPGLAARLGVADDIHFIGRVEEDDKPALYRAALGFCFPSQYEGFGLTPLEAMACGTPVLAADATSLPEVVGDAGLLLPADSVSAWADAMRHLISSASERDAMRARGLLRAARYSWRQTAADTLKVYRSVLGT